MIDVLRCHFLGEVEYSQHNFAKIRPLLYSVDGRNWTGRVDRSWFPHSGLAFCLISEVRKAAAGSLWTFQVILNPRLQSDDEDKDVYLVTHAKPAVRFLTELEPMSREQARILATIEGFDPQSAAGGVVFPETGERWVIAHEFELGDDGLARVNDRRKLPHMHVLVGSLADIVGIPTSDGKYILPPIIGAHESDTRNWLEPSALLEQLARDLRRWLPYAPYSSQASSVAQALRELAPALDGVSALRAHDAKAALERVNDLTHEAVDFTSAVNSLVEVLLGLPEIARALDEEREVIRRELETEALDSVLRMQDEARGQLEEEQSQIRQALSDQREEIAELKIERERALRELEELRRTQRVETESFTKSLERLVARAKTEPAAHAAEWLARHGLFEAGSTEPQRLALPDIAVPSPMNMPQIEESRLGAALIAAAPFRNSGLPKFLLMDALIRARELLVAYGPGARDAIETWSDSFVPLTVAVPASDPSLLSILDLLPNTQREPSPLTQAIRVAVANPERAVVGILDDVDVAAGSYWLPEMARALRRPQERGLPTNLFLVALVEGPFEKARMNSRRLGELFPMNFGDVTWTQSQPSDETKVEIPLALFEPPPANHSIADRVRAASSALSFTFSENDVKLLSEEIAMTLSWVKLGRERPTTISVATQSIANIVDKMTNGTDTDA